VQRPRIQSPDVDRDNQASRPLSHYQELVQLGQSMELKGSDLVDFVERRIREADEQAERQMQRDVELKRIEADVAARRYDAEVSRQSRSVHESEGAEFEKVKLRMPFFDDKEDLESFLGQFERLAVLQNFKRDTWAIRLGTLLSGKARDVYVRLSEEQASDYEVVKLALMTRFQLTSEAYRKKFRSGKCDSGESFMQFVSRLKLFLKRWMSLSKKPETFEGLRDLVLMEQLLDGLPVELATFIREREPEDVDQATVLAQQYADARKAWKVVVSGESSTKTALQSPQQL
jgi:hypothetical protein